jgi:RNA polymerase sigma factor (sigma-70 family)
MTTRSPSPVLRLIHRLAAPPGGDAADACLLERFRARRDEAAFAALVGRYGRLVLAVCRRVLRHEQDAEDAFQATFLALVRKADSIGKQEAVGSWLYGVAYRIAAKARAGAARRPRPSALTDVPAGAAEHGGRHELRAALDEEINRLPPRYRTPVVLCYLEGKTAEEAARQLGCPRGTVLSRLARARDRLRPRLARRGLALSAGALATGLASQAQAVPPETLVALTSRAALACTAGPAGIAAIPVPVATLTRGALRAMTLTKLGRIAAGLLAVAAVGGGAAVSFTYRAAAGPAAAVESRPAAEPSEGGAVEDLLTRVREQYQQIEERLRDGNAYADKTTLEQAYENALKDLRPEPAELEVFYDKLRKSLPGHKDEPAYVWRAQQLLGRVQADLKHPDKALEHYQLALKAYPATDYEEPSKHSSFQHLANEAAGVVWRHRGAADAEKFILQVFAESPQFQYFFRPWWTDRYTEAREPARERALMDRVVKAYADKGIKDADRAEIYRRYGRELKAQLETEPAVEERKAGGDAHKRYYLLAPQAPARGKPRPLLIVLPGGPGQGGEVLPFLKTLFAEAGGDYLFAVLSAPEWAPGQADRIVWPKERDALPEANFTTEAFVKAVYDELVKEGRADPRRAFLFGWSSGGPPVYSTALADKGPPLAGYYVLASVFNPRWLPPLEGAKGKRFYLQQGDSDRVTALHWAEKAEEALAKHGARVKLEVFEGGHGFAMPDATAAFLRALRWLEARE